MKHKAVKNPERWEELEDLIQGHLSLLQRKTPLMFQRFYDTKSAGSYIPTQPADFGILSDGNYFYLEAKFSGVSDSLKSCFSVVSDNQLASARLAARAGGNYAILFFSKPAQLFEIWPGLYCSEQRSTGKRLELSHRLVAYDIPSAISTILKP